MPVCICIHAHSICKGRGLPPQAMFPTSHVRWTPLNSANGGAIKTGSSSPGLVCFSEMRCALVVSLETAISLALILLSQTRPSPSQALPGNSCPSLPLYPALGWLLTADCLLTAFLSAVPHPMHPFCLCIEQ